MLPALPYWGTRLAHPAHWRLLPLWLFLGLEKHLGSPSLPNTEELTQRQILALPCPIPLRTELWTEVMEVQGSMAS